MKAALLVFSIAWVVYFSASCGDQSTVAQPVAEQRAKPEATATVDMPTAPPPHFRIYRAKFDSYSKNVFVSIVVPIGTTDEQLKSLLWFLRRNVRSRRFKDIGITKPIIQLGSGQMNVFRGEKCASEVIDDLNPATTSLGPCGYGDHHSAFYEWDLSADENTDQDKDDAMLISENGNSTLFFDQKTDHWKP